jgi:hypothetical protein
MTVRLSTLHQGEEEQEFACVSFGLSDAVSAPTAFYLVVQRHYAFETGGLSQKEESLLF